MLNKYRTLSTVALAILCLVSPPLSAGPALDATVLIYGADGEPKGAGVLVSPDGIVLTARHVVEDLQMTDEVTGRRYYRLKTTLRREGDNQLVPARLIAVHNFLDVASLQAEFDSEVTALKIRYELV